MQLVRDLVEQRSLLSVFLSFHDRQDLVPHVISHVLNEILSYSLAYILENEQALLLRLHTTCRDAYWSYYQRKYSKTPEMMYTDFRSSIATVFFSSNEKGHFLYGDLEFTPTAKISDDDYHRLYPSDEEQFAHRLIGVHYHISPHIG